MKTWDSWEKIVKFAGVAVLVFSLMLFGVIRSRGKHFGQPAMGRSSVTAAGAANAPLGKDGVKWASAYGKLPLSFEQNVGQTAQEVRFVSHGPGYELFLTPKEAVLALRAPVSHDLSPRHRFETARALREASRARTMTAVRMRFEGANPTAQISGTNELLKKTNYFIGSDPRRWHADVPSYRRVKYAGIYPGVDVVFYGNRRQLEYDFVVAPGADPRAIRLDLEGARHLRISGRGDVVLSVPGGEVLLQKPVVYQIVRGERREIKGRYALGKNHEVTFSVPSYDRSEPLILDPVLNYSTYLGGSSDEGFYPFGIAVDSSGNAYVAGTTFSSDFPTTSSGFDPGPPASGATNGAVFVTEMNPTGTAELYSTYLAGTTGELGVALALDPSGKIYVTGQTFSSDFPTTSNALKQSPNVANLNLGTSFISKIDPSLSGANSLVYSSYVGGTGATPGGLADFGNGIAVDASGNAYVTGITFSSPGTGLANFPVLNAYQATPTDRADGNAFLTRIDTTQSGTSSLIYSTYLGGAGANAGNLGFADAGYGVAVDSSSNAYIVGVTSSTDFPTTPSGVETTSPAGNLQGTGFVTKIDTTKSGNASLVYSTYLGGEVSDKGFGIALGPNNVAYATGTTESLLFPTTTGAFHTTGSAAGGLAFLSLVDTGKTGAASLPYSTYLGVTGTATGNAVRADGTGNAYVVGSTDKPDFPVTPGAFERVYPGAQANGFVTKISPSDNGAADLVYSTFFGGNGAGQEEGFAIALDAANPPNAFITGQTFSAASSFPVYPPATAVPPAFQTNLNGPSDAFVAKLTLIPTLVVSPTALNFGTVLIPTTSPAQTVTLTNNTNAAIAFTSATLTNGSPAAATTDYVISANTCSGGIPSGATPANQCTISVTFKPSVVGAETATLVLTDGDSTSPQSIALTGSGTNTAPDFTLTGPTGTQTVQDGKTLNFNVTVTGIGGFNSPVALTCTGAPSLATCTVTSPVTPPIAAPSTIQAQVSMTTTAGFVPPTRVPTPTLPARPLVPIVLALMLLISLRWVRRPRLRLAMAAVLVLIAFAGCTGPAKPSTPKGPATLTITGTSGALTHTVQVQISVN
ncbi:MAG: SBBP repeat-containing protein [Candidatus Acidiferrales bacterium]